MEHDADCQRSSFGCSCLRPLDAQADIPTHDDRQDHQPDKYRLTPGIEAKTGQQQEVIAEPP